MSILHLILSWSFLTNIQCFVSIHRICQENESNINTLSKCIEPNASCYGLSNISSNIADTFHATNLCNGISCVNETSTHLEFFNCRNLGAEKNNSKLTTSSQSDQSYVVLNWKNETSFSCPRGYKSMYLIHCEDTKECWIDHSQECLNIFRSFFCNLSNNYELAKSDITKCIQMKEQIIFYTTSHELKYHKIGSNITRTFIIPNLIMDAPHYFFAFDYYINGWDYEIILFWSDIKLGCIMRADFTSLEEPARNIDIIYSKDGSQITQIILDRRSKNLYWFDESDTSLNVMDLTKKIRIILFDHSTIYSINSLTIHNKQMKLFWVDLNFYFGKIARCSLNGKGYEIMVEDRMLPRTLAIDEDNDMLYWLEEGFRLMSTSAKYRLSKIIEVMKLPIGDPFGAIMLNNKYVYTDMSKNGEVFAVEISSPYVITQITPIKMAQTLKIAKQFFINARSDPCEENNCDQLCLSDYFSISYSCHCSPDFFLSSDGKHCKVKGNLLENNRTKKNNSFVKKSDKQYWNYKIAVVIIICITGFISIGICMYESYRAISIQKQIVVHVKLYDILNRTRLEECIIEPFDNDCTALLDDSLSDEKII